MERVYRALDYLAREDENAVSSLGERMLGEHFDAHDVLLATAAGEGTLSYKLHELVRQGYRLDLGRVEQIIKARML